MPRGHRKDVELTRLLFRNGLLLDRNSFVSLPRHDDGKPHLLLEGQDKVAQRPRVFKKWKFKCSVCRHLLSERDDVPNDVRGNWHHVRGCDCVDCSELRCDPMTGRPCHMHRTEGFHRKASDYGTDNRAA